MSEIRYNNDIVEYDNLQVFTYYDDDSDSWVIVVPQLDFVTHAADKESIHNIAYEGISAFLDGLIELGTIKEYLSDLGWSKDDSDKWSPPVWQQIDISKHNPSLSK